MLSTNYVSLMTGRGVRSSKSTAILELRRSINSSCLTLFDRPGDYTPYKDVYQYGGPAWGIPSFGAFRMMDSAGKEFPHFKAVIYNDLEADNNTCFRGELLITLRIMLGQLRKVRFVHHQIAPNSLFSFSPIPLYILGLLTGYSTGFTYIIGWHARTFIGVLF